MKVHPQSGLEIQIGNTGIVGYTIGGVNLIETIHHHVRHMIIGLWFEHGYMPRTWAELQGSQ